MKKLYLRLSLTQIVHSNDKMLSLKSNNDLSMFLCSAAHVLLVFTSRKSFVLCLGTRRRDVCSEDLVEKITIRFYKSFIQMVKYSFHDGRIV